MGRMVWSQKRRIQKHLGSLPFLPSAHQIKAVTVGRKMSETMDPGRNTKTKKKKKFPYIYKEIQNGAVAKSYMRKGFLICKNCANM